MSVYLDDGDAVLHHGDALTTLRTMPSASVHCIVTSPPFWALRDYGVDGQIGLEASPDEWCAALVAVFREARRVLRPDGVAWIEVGDTYAGSWGAQGREGETPGISSRQIAEAPRKASRTGAIPPGANFKPKDLCGAPWLLAKALRDPYYTGTIKRAEDRAWLAAMIEAEGCIFMHRSAAGKPTGRNGTPRGADNFGPGIHVTGSDPLIARRCMEIAGCGTVTSRPYSQKRTAHIWRMDRKDTRRILAELYPHMVSKRQQARIAIAAPSSGDRATEAWTALKLLHAGSETTVDFPAPPSLYEAGWFLRSDIVWARLRPNPMPESVTDRPTKAHSYVFLLSREPRYFYDAAAISERAEYTPKAGRNPTWEERKAAGATRGNVAFGGNEGTGTQRGVHGEGVRHDLGDGQTRNARSVWTIPTEPTPHAHFATFPQALAARCILAGTSGHGCCAQCGAPWTRSSERVDDPPDGSRAAAQRIAATGGAITGGTARSTLGSTPSWQSAGWAASCACNAAVEPCTVLDPFAGSATTLLVARHHGRRSVGIELSAEYLAIAATRLQQLSLLGGDAA